MSPVAAIVLAAGASRRLGMPKQLVQLGTETLLERAVRLALDAGLIPTYAVLPVDLSIGAMTHGIVSVINHQATEGMASSIAAGLRALASDGINVSGAVLLACDQPAVTSSHLRSLALGGNRIVASAYGGRKGVPAYFPKEVFEKLLALRGDVGARTLLSTAEAIDLPGGELDIDTINELHQARKLYSR